MQSKACNSLRRVAGHFGVRRRGFFLDFALPNKNVTPEWKTAGRFFVLTKL